MSQSVQSLSHVRLFATPWTAARQASLSLTNSWSLLRLMSIKSVMPFNHLILCHPLLLPPSIFPSIRIFSNESALHIRWPKYWSFSFNISPSNEYSGLISFTMDWLDLLAVQGTLKSLLQRHNPKASIIQCSAFFIVQLSHPYMTTGKTIALTRWIFVGKVMSLLFNMLSMLVITFLPRNKCLLISWLQSPSAVILEPPKIKSATVSPSISHEVIEQRMHGTGVAKRSYPTSKIRSSQEELPHVRGQEQWPRGVTPRPRSGVVAERRYPMSKVRSGSHEEMPHIQGKEQRLCFAVAAVKRYPTSKVRETQVRG